MTPKQKETLNLALYNKVKKMRKYITDNPETLQYEYETVEARQFDENMAQQIVGIFEQITTPTPWEKPTLSPDNSDSVSGEKGKS